MCQEPKGKRPKFADHWLGMLVGGESTAIRQGSRYLAIDRAFAAQGYKDQTLQEQQS